MKNLYKIEEDMKTQVETASKERIIASLEKLKELKGKYCTEDGCTNTLQYDSEIRGSVRVNIIRANTQCRWLCQRSSCNCMCASFRQQLWEVFASMQVFESCCTKRIFLLQASTPSLCSCYLGYVG